MDVPNGKDFPMHVLAAECLGTMFFALSVNMNNGTHIIGLAHAICILLVYEISGGHLNPAVSVGVFITTRKYYANIYFLLITMVA